MSSPEEQIIAAIQIASNPGLHPQQIATEAVEFLTKVRRESSQSWRPALTLFVATNASGEHTYPDDVRLFALNILHDFLDIRHTKGTLEDEVFVTLRDALLSYIQSEYLYGSAETKAPWIRNKFSHTLSLFFLASYETKWPDFFAAIFSLLKPPQETGIAPFNRYVSTFFFRLLIEISSEVADQVLKNARYYNVDRVARDGRIRDKIRENDALTINQAVLTIIAQEKQNLEEIRSKGGQESTNSIDEVLELGIKAFASYIPWIDINLTVTPDTIPLIFALLSDGSLTVRMATCSVLSNILSKGLKVPEDKLKLIQVMSLGPVLDQLEASTQTQPRGAENEALESYREGLGKVANNLGLELVALYTDTKLPPAEQQVAVELLEELLPVAVRFLADSYDDTSSTVFNFFHDLLSTYKKAKSAAPQLHMTPQKHEFLESLTKVLIVKMQWDPEDSPDDMDPEEKGVFEGTRKELRKLMDAILVVDFELVTQAISERANTALSDYESGKPLQWVEAELAIYLVYIYGELGGKDKGRLAFCVAPRTIPKAERKTIDYGEFPLTPQGEMMQLLVRSRISTYPHPTVAMQFFETVTRYADFFKVRKEYVLPALEAFLDNRGVHHPLSTVRKRVYYLFFRFVQSLRIDIEVAHIPTILRAIQDLLTVDVEVPSDYEPPSPSGSSTGPGDALEDMLSIPTIFDSQLNMFEASGALISALWTTPELQADELRAIMVPLISRLEAALTALGSVLTGVIENDAVPILTVHHLIRALGSIPKGFPEYPNPVPPEYVNPPLTEFRQMSESILVSLDVAGRFKVVREAVRFAFSRIIYAAGPSITLYIPRLMNALLAYFEPTELLDFVSFVGHMTHKIGEGMSEVVDQIIAPITTHVGTIISTPATGTDSKVARQDAKKGYLNFVSTITNSNLGSVFVSERNSATLGQFLETLLLIASECEDPMNQKLTIIFLAKFISTFATIPELQQVNATNGKVGAKPVTVQPPVPGLDQFIYQRIIPALFAIPSLPNFNTKDAQAVVVLNEIGNLLQVIMRARGQEAFDFLFNVFLSSQNWPQNTASELVTNMRDMDNKAFRKYFQDLVKALRPQTQ